MNHPPKNYFRHKRKGKRRRNVVDTIRNSEDETLLYRAARHGYVDIVEFLVEDIKAGIDTVCENGETPLFRAARYGHRKAVKYLLEHDADIDMVNEDNETPLYRAAYYGHSKTVKILINWEPEGADIDHQNENGDTPLHAAVSRNHYLVAELLVKEGARLLRNHSRKTPLDIAKNKKLDDFIELLEKKNSRSNSNSDSSSDGGSDGGDSSSSKRNKTVCCQSKCCENCQCCVSCNNCLYNFFRKGKCSCSLKS